MLVSPGYVQRPTQEVLESEPGPTGNALAVVANEQAASVISLEDVVRVLCDASQIAPVRQCSALMSPHEPRAQHAKVAATFFFLAIQCRLAPCHNLLCP